MMGRRDASAVGALVASRIAHDLASPIGAIANGVELLGLAGFENSPELALISESVANASARIKTFRIAFGAAQPGQIVPEAEIKAITAAEGRRFEIAWQVPGDLPRSEAKIAVLALLCLESAMPWGGSAAVARDGQHLRITARAERMNATPALWDFLAGTAPGPETLPPAQVQFLLLAAEAATQGRPIRLTRGDSDISITV